MFVSVAASSFPSVTHCKADVFQYPHVAETLMLLALRTSNVRMKGDSSPETLTGVRPAVKSTDNSGDAREELLSPAGGKAAA